MGNMQTHHQHAQLVDIIDDALEFIENFTSDFETLASIYFSTIPFAPASSLIANHYRARYPSTLSSIMPHPNNKWDELPIVGTLIHCAAATDGRHIFVNIENRIVRCFDAESGAELSSISIKHDWDALYLSSTFSPDGKLFALGLDACRVWNIETGEEDKCVIIECIRFAYIRIFFITVSLFFHSCFTLVCCQIFVSLLVRPDIRAFTWHQPRLVPFSAHRPHIDLR